MTKSVFATIAAILTLLTIVIIGGSEVARAADAATPMPIEMGRIYAPVDVVAADGWTVRPVEVETVDAFDELPVIEVRRVAVEPIERQTLPIIVTDDADPIITVATDERPALDVVPAYDGDAELNEAEVASLAVLNELRAGLGLASLRAAADLSDFAHSWAIIMSETDFAHSTASDSSYLFVDDRTSFGENIVWHSDKDLTPQEAADAFHRLWVESPGHYTNMVNPIWTEAGIGLFRNDDGWWGVHTFSNG